MFEGKMNDNVTTRELCSSIFIPAVDLSGSLKDALKTFAAGIFIEVI